MKVRASSPENRYDALNFEIKEKYEFLEHTDITNERQIWMTSTKINRIMHYINVYTTYILKASRPTHPHRELIFRKSFQDNWDRLNQRAAIAFTKLTLEEYTHQAEEVERRLTKATKSAQKNIAEHFKNEQELTTAHNLYKFFTRPRPPPTRGKKRPRERV